MLKLKKIINDSINIESKEFLSNLLNNSEIKNVRVIIKERTKLVFRFAMFILLISICFINLNNDKSRVNKFDNNKIIEEIVKTDVDKLELVDWNMITDIMAEEFNVKHEFSYNDIFSRRCLIELLRREYS